MRFLLPVTWGITAVKWTGDNYPFVLHDNVFMKILKKNEPVEDRRVRGRCRGRNEDGEGRVRSRSAAAVPTRAAQFRADFCRVERSFGSFRCVRCHKGTSVGLRFCFGDTFKTRRHFDHRGEDIDGWTRRSHTYGVFQSTDLAVS